MSLVKISGNASGTGTLTIAAPNTNTNYTLTLPTNTGTILTGSGAIGVNASAPSNSIALDSNGTITYPITTLANYQWTSWNPTNNTGTVTTAPSTGTTNDSNYVTMSNSSGTLTITFDVVGKYLISLTQQTQHASGYIYETFYFNLGGTATRIVGMNSLSNWGEPANDGDTSITTSFYVTATAAQTLTVQPQYRVSGGGATSVYIAHANATILYCGG
jgi:hypothetical protein